MEIKTRYKKSGLDVAEMYINLVMKIRYWKNKWFFYS